MTILGDFSIGIDNCYIGGFYDIHGFKILKIEPTGNKNRKKSTCVDIFKKDHLCSFAYLRLN